MGRPREATETKKICPDCKRVLPSEFFGVTKSEWSGRAQYCKECMNLQGKDRYQKRRTRQSANRQSFKFQYVTRLGGKCGRCGYNEFVSGLDFHHVGEDKKENNIASLITYAARGNQEQIALLEKEVVKCILLCRNCHSALHAGEWTMGDMLPIRRYTPQVKNILADLPLFDGHD